MLIKSVQANQDVPANKQMSVTETYKVKSSFLHQLRFTRQTAKL